MEIRLLTFLTRIFPKTEPSATSIRFRSELLQTAREIGLNISKMTEKALTEIISKVQGPNPKL